MSEDALRSRICAQVAQLLRDERQRQGLSLNGLAAQSGLSRSMVSYVEQLERNPTLDTLLRITGVLGVELETVIAMARKEATRGASSS